MLLEDRGAVSGRLLAAAARVAEVGAGEMIVICPPALADAADLDDWLAEQLAGYRVRLRVEVAPGEPQALRSRITELGCRVVAVEAKAGAARLRDFVDRFACDVLIVR